MNWPVLALLRIALRSLQQLTPCGVLLLLVCSACEPGQRPERVPAPRPSRLLGRWHYDSTSVARYTPQGELQYKSSEPMRAGAFLTINAHSWVFSGSLNEVHDYTRVGQELQTRRIGTLRMVQLGYITPDKIGQPLFTKKMTIVQLTPRQLILRNSVEEVDPHGGTSADFSVDKYYFSR